MLMRHANSGWHDDMADIERPLSERGLKDAMVMGRYLQQHDLVPDYVLMSPAKRTQQTLEYLSIDWKLNKDKQVFIDSALYLASHEILLESASAYFGRKNRLMLLAHNPGMDNVVNYLAKSKPALTATGELMVTAAIAVFRPESLEDLQRPGQCDLGMLLRPGELV